MKALRLTHILISALLFGCSKEKVDSTQIDLPINSIAGQFIGDSIIYFKYQPVQEVKGYRNGTDNAYTYSDSFSIFFKLEKLESIKFKYFQLYKEYDCPPSPDSNIIVDCFPDYWLNGSIELSPNIEIAYDSISELNYFGIKKFAQGDTINKYKFWTFKRLSILGNMQFSKPYDNWNINDYLSFIGFRILEKKDTVYGWIRVNTNNNSTILISDYAYYSK